MKPVELEDSAAVDFGKQRGWKREPKQQEHCPHWRPIGSGDNNQIHILS